MNSRIIVVEDELFIARDIKEILEEEGYEVAINVSSVEQAIGLIEETNPALVLVDINLNRSKDGVDLGHYLLNKDRIPFIYITSFTDKLTMDRVKETRPYGFIVKPFKTIDILTTVALVLNNYQYLQAAHYFIYKKDSKEEDSRLSAFIEEKEIDNTDWTTKLS